jgi:deoxycytidine triphosphate deaminase
MAETVTEKKVKIKLERTRNLKDDVWVCLNGNSYLIKRGEYVEVPEGVAEILQHKEEMLAKGEEYAESMKTK